MSRLPRLVATDLDGTIIRTDQTVSERVRLALRRAEEAGALVVFVSGRPPRWMREVAELTGHTGIAVCTNGAQTYDMRTETVIDEQPIDVETLAAVGRRLLADLPGLALALEYGFGFAHEPAYRHSHFIGVSECRVAAYHELVERPAAKLLARHAELAPDALLTRAVAVVGDLVTVTHASFDGLLEISAYGVTKATGLARLAARHGIAAADVIAFGDMPNDLAMLAWAGHSVAMGNGHEEVRQAADEVTADVNDDGVAVVLDRLYAQP
ncbi:MAG TPA: Cof-type HAD-IIB family hydrolase [Mycobacteriales bacterium]|nr:Cof-type HAD-IIB family hydrolase [Mycobacteriales bacterium]